MKQFLAFIAAGILALIALGSLAGIIGFAIGAGVVYWSYKSFVRAQSFFGKLAWGIVGLIGLSITSLRTVFNSDLRPSYIQP
ncbi:lmo0954 family membrane protein, partial [Bacillus sp. D-CC]